MSFELHHGDCLDVLRSLPDGSVDAVVTDPPYGIGCARAIHCTKPSRPNTYTSPPKYPAKLWDDSRPSRELFALLRESSQQQIIWGGNYFADLLPPSRGWLFWDKRFENTTNFSHGELAWTSLDMRLRKFTISSKAETRGGRDRVHPTQKPIALMEWCLSFLPEGCTVLDPFMGSGTTGVACVNTGRNFIGVEIDAGYYAIAQKRIEAAQRERESLLIPA